MQTLVNPISNNFLTNGIPNFGNNSFPKKELFEWRITFFGKGNNSLWCGPKIPLMYKGLIQRRLFVEPSLFGPS